MIKTIAIISVFLILWSPSQTQFYCSLSVMEMLLFTQERLIQHIASYEPYITDNKKAAIVQKFLSRCRKEQQLAQWNAAHYLGNPINSFTLIMRLTRDITYVEKILKETTAGMKYSEDNSLTYPADEDVVGVVEGMVRLQLLYDLDIQKMANGTLTTNLATKKPPIVEYSSPMTSCDCYELGLVEYDKHDRSRNVAWMKEALRRYEYASDCPINKIHIFDRLSGDYYNMGEYEKSLYWIQRRTETSPDNPQNEIFKSAIQILKGISTGNKKSIKKSRSWDFNFFPAMCLKTYIVPNASLTCYFAHGPHPFLILAPLKAERLHLSPDVLMFYDVISDQEILDLQELAAPRLKQGKAASESGPSTLNYCVHQVAELKDTASEATIRVARRIEQFSGLVVNRNSAEEFQVSNYGTGGYYGPHYDFIRPNSALVAKRYASAFFYMTNIEEGGATTFCKIGLTVFPVKNAAIFWWNLDSNGNYDFDSLHAVCPVLRGSKWVMEKWISLAGQELIRPCPANSLKEPPQEQASCPAYEMKLDVN